MEATDENGTWLQTNHIWKSWVWISTVSSILQHYINNVKYKTGWFIYTFVLLVLSINKVNEKKFSKVNKDNVLYETSFEPTTPKIVKL